MSSSIKDIALGIRLATPEDAHLPVYDYTMLSAINTCPTWGILRYELGKAMPPINGKPRRVLPLEFGAACHDAFAAVRICQLMQVQDAEAQATNRALNLWGPDRTRAVFKEYNPADTFKDNAMRMAIRALNTSGYKDDDTDKNRTLANAENALIAYIAEWDTEPEVWVRDYNDPKSDVGVEIIFDLVITLTMSHEHANALYVPQEIRHYPSDEICIVSFRYAGRIDGLRRYSLGLTTEENKTAARINQTWRDSYAISHQITGYCIAAGLFTGDPVDHAYAIGLQIPQPRGMFDGVAWEPLIRDQHNYHRWFQWLVHTVEIIWRNNRDPIHAPKYSHSCNRYFRSCSFIPFCYMEEDEQKNILAEMIDDPWTPLRELEIKSGD